MKRGPYQKKERRSPETIAPRKFWTTAEIKKVLTVWSVKTPQEIAIELGVTTAQVNYIAEQIRSAAKRLNKPCPVPSKRRHGQLQAMCTEIVREL